MLSVLTVGFIFIEEIEPCQFKPFHEVLKIRATGFQLAARVMFSPRSVISLAEP